MNICNGCGGVVGRDCFNPQECEWIRHQQALQQTMEYQVNPLLRLREQIDGMPFREELLGGQRTKYLQRDEVLGYIEAQVRAMGVTK